jgi:hypothetical protein
MPNDTPQPTNSQFILYTKKERNYFRVFTGIKTKYSG